MENDLFFGDEETCSDFSSGKHCVMCSTGIMEEIPSGMSACDTCGYSD